MTNRTNLCFALAFLSCIGCANPNMVGQRGDDLNMKYSLQDRRAAKMHIKVVESVPAEAEKMGDYTVKRCHQYFNEPAPSEATLTDDLVLLAYAEGADLVSNISFGGDSGLLKNCWYVAKGNGTFYRLKK